MSLICSSIPVWGCHKWLCKYHQTINLFLNLGANLVAKQLMFLSWVCLSKWGHRLREKRLNIYFRPYFTGTRWGMGRLYCGDSNGHVHFESFSSHISLTLRTPVLFIFRRVTRIGHGMKYTLRSLDKCPGKRRRRLQSFYLSMQEREWSR